MKLGEFLNMYCGGIKVEIAVPVGADLDDTMEIVTDHNQLQNTNIQQHFSWMFEYEVREFTITEDLEDEMTLFISLKRKEN